MTQFKLGVWPSMQARNAAFNGRRADSSLRTPQLSFARAATSTVIDTRQKHLASARALVGLSLAWMCGVVQADCYSIYAEKGELIYQNTSVPINLGNRIGDEVPKVWGANARMVFTPNTSDCSIVGADGKTDVMSGPQWAYMEAGLSPSGNVTLPASLTTGEGWASVGGSPSYRGGNAGSQTIYTGPKGGQYTVSPSGGKNYVRRR